MTAQPLPAEKLYRSCNTSDFSFITTQDIACLKAPIGQDRAIEALKFAVEIDAHGYNLYVLGEPGRDKHATVSNFLEQLAHTSPLHDWCYVNSFDNPLSPQILQLPQGKSRVLRDDMIQLVEDLLTYIPATFESDEYRNRQAELKQELHDKQHNAISELTQKAESMGMRLLHTPNGFAFAPEKNGEVLDNSQFEKLPEEEKERIREFTLQLRQELMDQIELYPNWHKEYREKKRQLDDEITRFAVEKPFNQLKEKYRNLPKVQHYLDSVKRDVIINANNFLRNDGELKDPTQFIRYMVNILVDNSELTSAPIIYESNPTYNNLLGRIDHVSENGTLITDFTLIRAGALHRANGGYLILDVAKVLMEPYTWQSLKRALFDKKLKTEPLAHLLGWLTTQTLEPQAVALDVKIILIGDRLLYYLLCYYDHEFKELFKVAADFEDDMPRDADSVHAFCQLIATLISENNLNHFDREAVARVIEERSRQASDSERLNTHTDHLLNLLQESSYWAKQANRKIVQLSDIEAALSSQIKRQDRIRKNIYEEIKRGTLLISTSGKVVGQINGLSVIQLGGFNFGVPSRITSTVRLGKGEILDIQREVELGGAIHSKAMLIVKSYIGAHYASMIPLSLSASIVFEQSYGVVEGDSASIGEVCALISALSNIPLSQSLAVTGSMNQLGKAQAVGGINEKIEGFYDICKQNGLTGDQGVLIPSDNIKHLMLKKELRDAVSREKFHIFPIDHVDDALSLLCNKEAGSINEAGDFPHGSINYLAQTRIKAFSKIMIDYAKSASPDAQ